MTQQAHNDLPIRVTGIIHSSMAGGEVDLAVVSRQIGIGCRTLQRQLNEQGTSFKELVRSVRQSVAERYLRDTVLSIGEIAKLTGYRNLSSFSHAFQRLYGVSPRDWRQLQHQATKPHLTTRRPQ